MRRYALAVTILSAVNGAVRAGLYTPGEPADFVPKDGKVFALAFDPTFRLKFLELTGAGAALDPRFRTSDLGKRILAKVNEMEPRKARLNAEELTTLGAYEYRLASFDPAMGDLLQATRMDRANFRATSDLGMVYFVQGQYTEAFQYLAGAKTLQLKELP